MDETRLRAVIREEIALAFQALKAGAEANDWAYETPEIDSRALENVKRSAESAVGEFKELCEKADEQRAEDAKNPFEDRPDTGPDSVTTAAIRAEVQNVLREMRDSFYGSGMRGDYQIAERLDRLITARERNTDE